MLVSCFLAMSCQAVLADDPVKTDATTTDAKPATSSDRDFYKVLEDVVSDFEFDIKNGAVIGLKDLSIRNVSVSENIPASFKQHLELLLSERILKSGKAKIIQCLACKSRRTVLEKDRVVVSSIATNQDQLAKIAKANGIYSFMDVAFTLESSAMILSLSIVDAESGLVVWSHGYNSENSRVAAFRNGVDYSQLDMARQQTEYVPLTQMRFMLYVLNEPNIASSGTLLALAFRSMERYNNRKNEVGFELAYMASSRSIVSKSSTSKTTDLYHAYGFNLTLIFMHAWNLIGEEENYNQWRSSLLLGLGGTYVSGYLGALVRGAWEIRYGKRFTSSFVLGYRPAATAFINGANQSNIVGMEYGFGVGVLF
jgi:hypothetical protein